MNLRKLVGKKVVRSKPVICNNVEDYSYTDINYYNITVVDIVNNIPIIRLEDNTLGLEVRGISAIYDDDNWIDVTEAHDFINKANNILKKENKDGKRE